MTNIDKANCQQLANTLLQHDKLVTVAESCTGGWLAQELTSIAGSSAWFERGFVTYTNAAKQEMLGVQVQTLAQYGAVSEQCAREMAVGALQHSHAQLSAAITGIAGPSGGSHDKPVGMVCFAFADASQVITAMQQFAGDRQDVRAQAVNYAVRGLLELLGTVA